MGRKKREPQHAMAKRLQAVVNRSGLTLKEFRNRLVEGGKYEVAYQSVQNYHFDREAPAHYLARVAKVFDADLAYLVTGERSAEGTDPATESRPKDVFDSPAGAAYLEAVNDGFYTCREAIGQFPRFLGPHSRASQGYSSSMASIVDGIRRWSGRDLHYFPPVQADEAEFPTKEEMEVGVAEILVTYGLMEDLLANAWDGMRRIVANEFGPASADRLTLDQQSRFRDAMLVTLTGLFPDHGEPAAFKEKTDG